MLKLVLIAMIVTAANAQVGLWGQCGGKSYTGSRSCASNLYCKYDNEWYSQCRPSSELGGSTTTTTRAAGTTTTARTTGQTVTIGSTTRPSSSGNALARFINNRFRVGRSWDNANTDYSQFDYVSIWINTPASDNPKNTDWNPWYQGEMLKKVVELGKIPVFYAYIIAFQARADADLQDCDVRKGWGNLCTDGSDYIKNNRAKLVSRYSHHAKSIAAILKSKQDTVVFIMEPDFWQYYGDVDTQKGGALSGQYMSDLYKDFIAAIKTELPNAIISWDISAWIGEHGERGMRTWWGFFKNLPIDFIHTSGGQARGDASQIKPNEIAWSKVHEITGKYIIADCGYGVGGAPTPANCDVWKSASNQDARIKDGVVALTQANANGVPTKKSLAY